MAYYQIENSLMPGRYDCRRYVDFAFSTHLHRHPELVIALSGEIVLSVGARTETLHAGDAALILPHEPHGYSTPAASEVIVTVFSADYAGDVFAFLRGRHAVSSVFRPNICDFEYARVVLEAEASSPYRRRAALYALLSAFIEQAELVAGSETDELIARVLAEMSERAGDETLTMAGIAEALGYEKHYLSRRFNRALNVNFRTLLTRCRLDTALSLLRGGDLGVDEIARRSGFASLRALDRACREATGLTPTQWKNQR